MISVENGFRFGRVTTNVQSQHPSGLIALKMASDSEGLRHGTLTGTDNLNFVENGFRFGRVTTDFFLHVCLWNMLKMASDSEGLRLTYKFRTSVIIQPR